MAYNEYLQSELDKARRKVEALPEWRRAVLQRAREVEIELGYIRPRQSSVEREFCRRTDDAPLSLTSLPPNP
jgi:hypothetical protein